MSNNPDQSSRLEELWDYVCSLEDSALKRLYKDHYPVSEDRDGMEIFPGKEEMQAKLVDSLYYDDQR